jgi:hypothetical protein
LKFSFSVGFAEVNCRTDSARVCVDILNHQGTSFGNATGCVETNSKQGAIALRKQTFVEQKLDFLLREYFRLAVPFYLHTGVYTRPDTRKFAAFTALLHRFTVFFNAVARGVKGKKGYGKFERNNRYRVF